MNDLYRFGQPEFQNVMLSLGLFERSAGTRATDCEWRLGPGMTFAY